MGRLGRLVGLCGVGGVGGWLSVGSPWSPFPRPACPPDGCLLLAIVFRAAERPVYNLGGWLAGWLPGEPIYNLGRG